MSLILKVIIVALSILLSLAVDSGISQSYFAFALILIFGIPHGATDHVLHNIMRKEKIDTVPELWFLLFYLGVILLYALIWYLVPEIALLLFIIISAYHFGETQLIKLEGREIFKIFTYLFWGQSLLLIIFYPHLTEVAEIISPYLISETSSEWIIEHYLIFLVSSLSGTIVGILVLNFKTIVPQVFELLILFTLSYFTTLLIAFAVFFAFWHSRDATYLQIKKISKKMGEFSFLQWLKLALPYTLVSLLGIALIIGFSEYRQLQMPSITLFFILVSLITMPHVIVMASFYRH